MKTDTNHLPESGDRRQRMEWMAGRYTDLSREEVPEAVHYLTKQASAADVGILASNQRIRSRYQRLTANHHPDRPGPFAWAATAVLCGIIAPASTLAMASP